MSEVAPNILLAMCVNPLWPTGQMKIAFTEIDEIQIPFYGVTWRFRRTNEYVDGLRLYTFYGNKPEKYPEGDIRRKT